MKEDDRDEELEKKEEEWGIRRRVKDGLISINMAG